MYFRGFVRFIIVQVVQSVDMTQDMAGEAMEVITMSVDKHQATKNYEVRLKFAVVGFIKLIVLSKAAAQLIKATLDKKFGAAWHCAIGEGFGFDITYQAKNMIYVYYGTIGVLCYKC